MPSNISIASHKSIAKQVGEKQNEALFSFVSFCVQELQLNGPVIIRLTPKVVNGKITTGSFTKGTNVILARFEGRALVDVVRTIAHELVHQQQSERGEFDDPERRIPDIGGEIEDEANAIAGQLIKKFVRDNNARYIYEL